MKYLVLIAMAVIPFVILEAGEEKNPGFFEENISSCWVFPEPPEEAIVRRRGKKYELEYFYKERNKTLLFSRLQNGEIWKFPLDRFKSQRRNFRAATIKEVMEQVRAFILARKPGVCS